MSYLSCISHRGSIRNKVLAQNLLQLQLLYVFNLPLISGMLTFSVDNEVYGTVPISNYQDFNEEVTNIKLTFLCDYNQKWFQLHITLGVGVGGINDFPDGYTSSGAAKPWQNKYRNEVKDFYSARDSWKKTWNNNDCALQVDYVKVTAL